MRRNSLTERLKYWSIEDGVVFNYNGQVEVGVELFLPSQAFMTDEIAQNVYGAIRNVLKRGTLPGCRTRLYIESAEVGATTIMRYMDSLKINSLFSKELRESYCELLNKVRLKGNVKTVRYYLTTTLFRKPRAIKTSYTESEYEEIMAKAFEHRERLKRLCRAAGYQAEDMKTDQVYSMIHRWLNPNMQTLQVKYDDNPKKRIFLDEDTLKENPEWVVPTLRRQLVANEIIVGSDTLVVGDRLVKSVMLQGTPEFTSLGMINRLVNELRNHTYHIVIDCQMMITGQIRRQVSSDYAASLGMAEDDGPNWMKDPSYKQAVRNAEGTLDKLNDGSYAFKTAITVMLNTTNDTQMAVAKETALAALTTLGGANPVIGTYINQELFLEKLPPFMGELHPQPFMLLDDNTADFFPVAGRWQGTSSISSILLNRDNALVPIDTFDRIANNYNVMIVGGSGSGKSFLIHTLAEDKMGQGAKIYILDRGQGYVNFTRSFDGAIVEVDIGKTSMNPMQLPPGVVEPDVEMRGRQRQIIRSMIPNVKPENESVENALIDVALVKTFAEALQTYKFAGEEQRVFKQPLLRDFRRSLKQLNDLNGSPLNEDAKKIAEDLANRLSNWTENSLYGTFVDRETSVDLSANVVYFETKNLELYPDLGETALLLINHMIRLDAVAQRDRQKVIVLDECWSLLKNPTARAMIVDWFKTARKENTGIWAASQDINDFAGIGIFTNISYFFIGTNQSGKSLMENIEGFTPRAVELYKLMGSEQSGDYKEFMLMIRTRYGNQGDIIRNRISSLKYWTYTSDPDEVVALQHLAKVRYQGDIRAAIRHKAEERDNAYQAQPA